LAAALNTIYASLLPESIGQLAQLKRLNLFGNQLSALPESIGELAQLEELDLSDNQLRALPESVLALTEADGLRRLYLHGNDALGIPREILGPLSNEVNNRGNLIRTSN
jgi:internalin A